MPIRPMSATLLAAAALAATALALALPRVSSAETAKLVPAPTSDAPSAAASEKAILAGGCFWGVQGVFQHVRGVTSAVSGYAGGGAQDASYPSVSSGTTGHAESVEITYDPRQVSFGKLLQIYFSVVADPTTLNAQGPDRGPQYRSAVFATTADQLRVAKDYIAQLQGARVFAEPIVTEVAAGQAFYPAEAYHQNYLTLHPHSPYIAFNDMPKVEGLRKFFAGEYREAPALVAAASN